MGQWHHLGLAGQKPTSGGLQVIDDTIYFHTAENHGMLLRSGDQGHNWQPMYFSDKGRSSKYIRFKEHKYIIHDDGMSDVNAFYRHSEGENDWTERFPSATNFDVFNNGRVMLATGDVSDGAPIKVSDQQGTTWETSFSTDGTFGARLIGRDGQGRSIIQTFDVGGASPDDIALFRSSDNGATWERFGNSHFDLTNASFNEDHNAFCSNGGIILRSEDDGARWNGTPVPFNYPFNSGTSVYYVGHGHLFFMDHNDQQGGPTSHFFESFDYGASWASVEDEIAKYLVYNIDRDRSGNLFASTSNGVYMFGTTDHSGNSASIYELRAEIPLYAYPNPAQDKVTVTAGGAMIKQVTFLDRSSREVLVVRKIDKPAVAINLARMAPGVYVMQAITDKGVAAINVVVE